MTNYVWRDRGSLFDSKPSHHENDRSQFSMRPKPHRGNTEWKKTGDLVSGSAVTGSGARALASKYTGETKGKDKANTR